MPDLVGKTRTEAENLITMYKLSQGRIEPQHDETVEEGKVISQYPLANTKVDEGTVVNLIISSGPDPEQQPPTPPPVEPDPNLVTREETIDLSNYEGIINLRVLMDGVEVCNENVDTTMDVSWPVRVSGTGVKELAIYINGIASGTKEVDFTQGSNIQ